MEITLPDLTSQLALDERLALLPAQPGVYLMKNAEGQILYIGKARRLDRRVRSYFQDRPLHGPKIEVMVPLVRQIDTIITDTEVEALVLEEQLIRKYQPRYNTLLKNSKGFPYIRISWQDPYPRVDMAHQRRVGDPAIYYGPYPSRHAVSGLLHAIRELFPVEKCKDPRKEKQVCIYYNIKRCLGHCQKKVSSEDYKDMLQDIRLFLEGKSDQLQEKLKARMRYHAERTQFEQAAQIRDTLNSLQRYIVPAGRQKIIGKPEWQLDVIQMSRNALMCHVVVFPVRNGELQTPLPQTFTIQRQDEDPEILQRFLFQFYARHGEIPPEILLPLEFEDAALNDWLSAQRGSRVKLSMPQRGDKKALLEMVAKNANSGLQQAETAQRYEMSLEGLQELQSLLELKQLPARIEGFDISHFQGQETVASMVVFEGGIACKSDYRRFKIVSAEGMPNDFLSMEEVVTRRYKSLRDKGLPLPDLILIDGGKGQVSAAMKAFDKLNISPPALIGLAKKEELIVLPDRKELVRLPRHSPALRLLQQVRDESHRFALGYQRARRSKRTLDSELNTISGIGAQRRQELLRRFGSVDKIRKAELSDLMLTGGLPRAVAQRVYDYFHPAQS
ncbi:MAG: excinuclease ABC subunit UvrC [Candidatus Sericytochromatia bacterium]